MRGLALLAESPEPDGITKFPRPAARVLARVMAGDFLFQVEDRSATPRVRYNVNYSIDRETQTVHVRAIRAVPIR